MRLNHPETIPPSQWKNCLPQTRSLVPQRLGGPLHGLCAAFQSPASQYTPMWTRPGLETGATRCSVIDQNQTKLRIRILGGTSHVSVARDPCAAGAALLDGRQRTVPPTGGSTGWPGWCVDHVEMSLHQLFRACWSPPPSLIKSTIVSLKKSGVPTGFTTVFDKSFICPLRHCKENGGLSKMLVDKNTRHPGSPDNPPQNHIASSGGSISPLLSDLLCPEAVAPNKFNQLVAFEMQFNQLITFEVHAL